MEFAKVLFELSLRNLFAHKLKTAIVGALMFFGTWLVVVGTSLVDTIEGSMEKSITSSLAGHLQVYSSKAKDPLAIFGGMMMGKEDIGRIPDFEVLRTVLEKVPNVAAIVPMGLDIATVTGGNETDRLVTDLRAAHAQGDQARVGVLTGQIKANAADLRKEMTARLQITEKPEEIEESMKVIDRVLSEELWTGLAGGAPAAGGAGAGTPGSESENVFQYLETKLAPLSTDGLLIYFRYVGTDVDRFQQNFETFEVVKGEAIPSGKRGFMFANKFYEDQIKHKVARDLDRLHREVTENGKPIKGDPLLEALASQIPRQQRRIIVQLDTAEREQVRTKLLALMPEHQDKANDLDALVSAFLTVSDANIRERHRAFYEIIAPLVELYQVKVGDVMTVRGFTQAGYLKAVNVKVYGTFRFKGLEKSDLAAGANIMDMLTFRELYGLMSSERRAELDAIKEKVGIADVARDDVEAELFGSDDSAAVATRETGTFDELDGVNMRDENARMRDLMTQSFDQGAIDKGVALNAAIILKDPKQLKTTQAAIEAAIQDAKLEAQVVDWQAASGIVGQFIYVLRGVLSIAIFVIFLVTIVIINNSMVMATMDRVAEIGTMRAIGAGRRTVMAMVLTETVVLGLLAGGLGALIGAGTVTWIGSVGIPAGTTDILIFLFAGPRLYPVVGVSNIVVGVVVIMVVSVVSTLYPARLASRIQPVVAMQGKE